MTFVTAYTINKEGAQIMFIFFIIVFQLVIFITLAFFLRRMLNRNVVSATTHLDQLASEYSRKEEEIKKQLESAKRQCQELLNSAQEDGEKKKIEILKKADEERKKVISDAQVKADEIIQQADRARMSLLADINRKIEEGAVTQAAELLQSSLPEDIRKQIHELWFKNLISSSFDQLNRLHIPEGCAEAKIVTAFILNAEQREAVVNKIKEKIGFKLELKEEVNPQNIAGLVVTIGSLVLDGSLKFKIQEVARAGKPGS